MEVLYARCCGLDVHKSSITACGKRLVNRLPSGFLARCPGRRIQAWVVDPIGFQL